MTNILVVGVGSIGERHVRCFGRTGRAEISICEPNESLRDTIAGRYGTVAAHATLDLALRQRPDAAVVCTPAHLHVPMAIDLARAGVDLLVEKPLSVSLDRIDELRQVLEPRQPCFAVAYVLRHHPVVDAMRQALASGRFGSPVEVVVVGGQHFPTFRPAYRQIYYTRRETGGGAIQDALTHLINAVEWLVGPIDRLAADAAHQVLEGVEVEDTVHLVARHGGVMSSFSLNQHQAPNETTITVICQRGTIRGELHENRWRWLTEPGAAWQSESFSLERDDLFVAQAHAFLDAREGTAPVRCGLDDAWQTLRVNLAALRALDSQRWERL